MTNLIPMNSFFNRWPSIWDDDDRGMISPTYVNHIDVYENENDVVVKANVAGIPAKDIDLTFEKGVLLIKAQAETEQKDDKNKWYNKSSWSYSYKVAVPGTIDHTKEPTVTLENGVLTATFHKAEISKPKKLNITEKK